MAIMQTRSLSTPEEIKTLPKTTVEVITFGEVSLMKLTFQPGWHWSERVKPTAWTERCEVPHFHYCLSGRLHVRMDVGTESEIGPGDAQLFPSWHDAWAVGEEPSVGLDVQGASLRQVAPVTRTGRSRRWCSSPAPIAPSREVGWLLYLRINHEPLSLKSPTYALAVFSCGIAYLYIRPRFLPAMLPLLSKVRAAKGVKDERTRYFEIWTSHRPSGGR